MHSVPAKNLSFTIELFGGLRVRRGERVVTHIKRQKSAALLAYLACHSNRIHSREVLIELLWPESDPESARNRLNVTFSRLREELSQVLTDADSIFISDRTQIGINRESVRTDLEEFGERLKKAATADDEVTRALYLESAIDLYRGPLLPGLYDAWISVEHERIRERLNRALSDLIGALEVNGRTDEAIEYARKVVAAEPLLEHAHETLIRLLINVGRPGDALQQYRSLENHLRQELDIAPSVETEALLDAIRKASVPPNGYGANGNVRALPPDLIPSNTEPPNVDPKIRQQSASISLQPKRRVGTFVRVGTSMAILAGIGIMGLRPLLNQTGKPTAAKPSAGGKLLWEWKYTLANDEDKGKGSEPQMVTSDSAGNLYATGFVQTKAHDTDFVTLKLAPDGKLLWKQRWNNAKANDCDRARKIAVDGEGNVYVTGDSYGGDREKGGTQWDVATVKYSPEGKELWSRRFNGAPHNDDMPLGMALDQSGNAYVAATSKRADGTVVCALVKYDRNGGDGGTVIADTLSNGLKFKDLHVHSFTNDGHGNILICGSAAVIDAAGRQTRDLCTLRYDRHLNQVWHRRFATDNSQAAVGSVMTVDSEQNVYIAGTYRIAGRATAPNDHTVPLNRIPNTGYLAYGDGPGENFEGILVVKYDNQGNELWSVPYRPANRQQKAGPKFISTDGQGGVYISAEMEGPTTAYHSFAMHVSSNGRLLSDNSMPFCASGPLAASATGKTYWWGALGDGNPYGAQKEIVLEPLYPRSPSETGFRPSDRHALPPGTRADLEILHACADGHIVGAARIVTDNLASLTLFKYSP